MASNYEIGNNINQWISTIVNVDSKHLNNDSNNESIGFKIIGPPSGESLAAENQINTIGDLQINENLDDSSCVTPKDNDDDNNAYHNSIVVKIPESVFIDSIDIYENKCDGSIMRIDALEGENKWMCLWKCNKAHAVNQARVFKPTIRPTPFKCDTLKITINGNLYLIDAIEVKGSKRMLMRSMTSVDQSRETFGELSRQLRKLVGNDLFADVYFEVEGKRIAGHRNILGYRSDYFKAMFGRNNNSGFRESNQQNPVYIPDISYEVFMQVLNFLYTGHIDIFEVSCCTAVELIRAADQFNISKLENLILYYLNEIVDAENVVKIYREASEKLPILQNVLDICYAVMRSDFGAVAESEDFCALPQDLMIRLIENVIPALSGQPTNQSPPQHQQQQHQQQEQQIQNPPFQADEAEEDTDTESENSLLNY